MRRERGDFFFPAVFLSTTMSVSGTIDFPIDSLDGLDRSRDASRDVNRWTYSTRLFG